MTDLSAAVAQFASTRGGTHQKNANAASIGLVAPEPEVKESYLALTLVELVSYGVLSLPWVQQIAADAVADGLIHPELLKISSMGASGQQAGNLSRDFNDASLTFSVSYAFNFKGGFEGTTFGVVLNLEGGIPPEGPRHTYISNPPSHKTLNSKYNNVTSTTHCWFLNVGWLWVVVACFCFLTNHTGILRARYDANASSAGDPFNFG